jgi:uncharacterized protein (TIGR03083 family)
MTDATRLHDLVETWHTTAGDAVALLRELPEVDWTLPTDLPGWDVRAVGSHLAHLESELAGNPQEQVDVPEADHVKGLMGQFTEAGVLARAGRSPAEVVDELESSVAKRYAELTTDPPTDAAAPGPGFAGLIGWSWETLLTNRPFDLWMHEQDIRRATGRPGNLDTAGAAHAVGVCARSLGYVLGKRAQAPAGSTLVVELSSPHPQVFAVQIGEDGRGRPCAEVPEDPTVRLRIDRETFIVLSGGRRRAEDVDVAVAGDEELAGRVLAGMAVTP